MAQQTTRVSNGLLLEDRVVEVGVPSSIPVDSAAWYDWLNQQHSFRFEHEGTGYTARKEQRPGGWYWYASRRIHGTLYTVYLGRSEDLTQARLNLVAQRLSAIAVTRTDHKKTANKTRRTDPLLMTKLSAPKPRPDLVTRQRLLARLQAGVQCRVQLIVASAGYGKTMLLSSWLASLDSPSAWIMLEESDNDPLRFWHYVVAALETLGIKQGMQLLSALNTRQPPPIEVFLTGLINLLVAQQEQIVLAFDDYHEITNELIHRAMQFLLDHLPAQVHVVLASRTEPPLALARLRALGEVNDVHQDDLRFTGDETAAFFAQRMRLDLPAKEVAQLHAHTEGWAAGLQLAALSLQQWNSPTDFMPSASLYNRYIFGYFLEEVLNRLSSSTQDFLLATSILTRLYGPLCDAVTEGSGGAERLTALEQTNLFVLPLDPLQSWYRYHHLFAETLRRLLEQRYPERVTTLHTRAAHWYERHGQIHEAIHHALAASNIELAAQLIEAFTTHTGWYGGIETRRAWLAALPAEVVRSRPRLSVLYALACMEQNLFAAAEPALQDAEAASHLLEDGEQPILRGELAAIRSTIAINLGRTAEAVQPARQALELLPRGEQRFLATLGQVVLNLADTCLDDAERAQELYAEAVSLNREAGNVATAITAMSGGGGVYMQRGQLHEAERLLHQALSLGGETLLPWPSTGKAHIRLGEVYYEWNRLPEALYHAHEGIQHCEQWGHVYHLGEGLLLLAQIQAAQGDVEAGIATLEYGRRLVDKSTLGAPGPLSIPRMRELSLRLGMQQVDFLLTQGDLEDAVYHAQQCGLSLIIYPSQRPGMHDATLARLLLALRRIDAARELLAINAFSLSRDKNAGWITNVIRALLMRTTVLEASGARELALLDLEHALKLAAPGGLMRTFLDAGPAIPRLLAIANERSKAPSGYIPQILDAVEAEQSASSLPPLTLTETLSDRELVVLHLLVAGLSSAEIAQHLIIGISTARTHIKHIYQKLNVHTRAQAKERAHELRLL